MKKLNLEGEKYGRLTVIEAVENIGRYPAWKCVCDCGKQVTVTTQKLRAGTTKSCGCLRKEIAGKQFHDMNLQRAKYAPRKTTHGYIALHEPDNPSATKSSGNILQHRKVMEAFIGRPLTPDEIVHHKNGIKTDNRIENLQIMSKSEHMSLHMTELWKRRKGY